MKNRKSRSSSRSRKGRSRQYRKWYSLVGIVLVLVLFFGGYLAWDKAKPRYHQWKQDRALEQAAQFMKDQKPQKAQMALEVALKEIPGNPKAIRMAADMLEQSGSPQAMRLRRTVMEAVPDSAEDRAKLVVSCIRFRDFNAARDVIRQTSVAMSQETPMLQAALSFALATNDVPVADALFAELKTRLTSDVDLQQAHALLRLEHPDEAVRLKAKAELEVLAREHAEYSLRIEEGLAGYALKHQNYDEAKDLYERILAHPEAAFRHRLNHANLDLLVDKVPFEELFEELAPQATGNAEDVVRFTQWLLIQDRAVQADEWLLTLPDSLQQEALVKSVQADVVMQLKDWDRLNTMLEAGAWGPLVKDSLRLVMAAKTVNDPNRLSLRAEVWDMALSSAGTDMRTLGVLQKLAATWGWEPEIERSLWTIAKMFPDQTQTHQALFNLYRQKRNTAKMRDVMQMLRDSDPRVLRYQHDWALLSILTDNTLSWTNAKETMRKLYEMNPHDPIYATGYGFALAKSKKPKEALAVIQKLSIAERDYPPRQPYLSLIYGLARMEDDLRRAQALGAGLDLLPEEQFLFKRAEDELKRKSEKPKLKRAASRMTSPSAETP